MDPLTTQFLDFGRLTSLSIIASTYVLLSWGREARLGAPQNSPRIPPYQPGNSPALARKFLSFCVFRFFETGAMFYSFPRNSVCPWFQIFTKNPCVLRLSRVSTAAERWPSGRRRSPAKGVYVKSVSRVRIPSSPPPPSKILHEAPHAYPSVSVRGCAAPPALFHRPLLVQSIIIRNLVSCDAE